MPAQVHQLLARLGRYEAVIDQALEGYRKGQGAGSCQEQEQHRQADLQPIGPQKRQQSAQ